MLPLQKELYRLYKEIDVICRRHNIEYYLAGGTCIGALRHKGFLPWDDDMDLYMTRKNWDKFIEVSKYDFPENRVLLCPELDPTYTNLFGRYCDTSTTSLHKHNMYVKHNEDDPCGYIIDILPLDPIPYSEELFNEYAQKICILSELLNPIGNYSARWLVSPVKYISYAWRALWNREKVIKELFHDLFSYEEDDCDYYAMRWGGIPLIFPKEWFRKPTEVLYEDTIAMMPTMNNAYLTMHYGDGWCYLPKSTEQGGHVAIHRQDIPYFQFRKEYEAIVSHHHRFYVKFVVSIQRIFRMLWMPTANKLAMDRLNLLGQKLLDACGVQTEETLSKLNDLLHHCKLDEIQNMIGPFVSMQLSAKYLGRDDFVNILRFNHPVLVKMSDEFFEFLVRYCMYSNRIWASMRLIEIREKKDKLTPSIQELKEDILFFRAAVNDYDLKDFITSYKKALQLAKKHPNWDALIKLRLRLILYKGQGTTGDAEKLLRLANALYSSDGEFSKYQLDFDRSRGTVFSLEESLKINASIINTTRNGIIRLAVCDEMDTNAEEYFKKISSFIQEKDYTNAAAWLDLCRPLYKNDQFEQLSLLQAELDLALTEEIEDTKVSFQKKSKILEYLENKVSTAEFQKEKWIDLYCKTLKSCAYGNDAINHLLTLLKLSENYVALSSAMNDIPKGNSADQLIVHGRYFYALGKTRMAEEAYREAYTASANVPFLNYQAQNLLSEYIGIKKTFAKLEA